MAAATSTEAVDEPTAAATTEGETPTEIYGFPIEPAENTNGTLVYGTAYGTWGSLLTIFGTWHSHETLAERHPTTGEVMPLLATSWEASDDALTWVAVLRPGVTFYDGTPLTPADVVFSVQLRNRVTGAGIDPIRSATVRELDAESVEFTFPQTAIFVPEGWQGYGVYAAEPLNDLDLETVDENTILNHPANTGEDLSRLLTTGPFRIAEIIQDEAQTFERNDRYWGGMPNLQRLIRRVFAESDAMIPALQTGEIDLAGGSFESFNPAQVGELESDATRVAEFQYIEITVLELNQNPETTTLFEDVQVRQALMMGLDREAIIEAALFGYGSIPPTMSLLVSAEYESAGITRRYEYDPEQAAAMLDEAGWVVGSDGIREKDGQRFEFTAWYRAGQTVVGTAALIMQEQWRALGIAMTPQSEDDAAYFARAYDTRDFEALFGVTEGDFVDPRFFYSCDPDTDSDAYRLGACNDELAGLAEAAAAEIDPETRRSIQTQIQNMAFELLPWLPLFIPTGLNGVRTDAHNIYPNPFNEVFNCETWWVDE
jgi:ABC-type transport system substrate-binding protein